MKKDILEVVIFALILFAFVVTGNLFAYWAIGGFNS